jgi:hypothetical protein
MDDGFLLWLLVMVLVLTWTTPTRANIDPSRPTPVEERAMTFLKSLPREWSHSSALDCKTYEDKNIERLAVPFATAAADFLDAFRQLHGAVTITSAHRTAQEQVCVCIGEKGPCAGRPHEAKGKDGRRVVVRGISRHQLGVALDVRPGTGRVNEFVCLHKFAQLNPQFGVYFPLGSRDYPHMELRLPPLHGPGMPPLAVPSCPASNASTAFHSPLTRDLDHGDGMSVAGWPAGDQGGWKADARGL